MESAFVKVGLAVGAVVVALLAGSLTGGVLTATGEETPARVTQVQPDDDESPGGNPAARAFVAAKKAWTTCVAEAAPARESGAGRFDPEQACGDKPHPHDFGAKHDKAEHAHEHGHQQDGDHGRPAWAGGPERRTAEPPGHVTGDQRRD